MTSNMDLELIHQLLDEADQQDVNIRITRTVGKKVNFLDVSIENDRGRLKTTVHHKPAAEPYIVPFVSDHPRHIHRNSIIGSLYRAIRLCSSLDDFKKERLNIELMLLLNGYPPRFVRYHMIKFRERNNASTILYESDQVLYETLNKRLLSEPTRRERRINQSTTSDHDFKPIPHHRIRAFVTFESRLTNSLKHKLNTLWGQHYQYPGSPVHGVRLLFVMHTNPSLNALLVKKRPYRRLLRYAQDR